MYYGNTSATDQQATTTVWNSDYKMVYHFAETTNGNTDFKDSTANKYDSAAAVIGTSGESDASAAGKASGGIRLDGTDDYIQTESFTLGSNFTVSVWVNSDVADQGTYNRIIENLYSSHFYLGTGVNGNEYKFIVKNGTSPFGTAHGSAITAGGWQFVAGVYNGTTGTLYVNGASVASGSFTAPGNVTDDIFIGKYSGGASNYWNGYVDEVQISNTNRSADWISASYKTQNGTFLTYGGEDTDVPSVARGGGGGGGGGYVSAASGAAEETTGATNVGPANTAWWNTSWTRRRQITFDNSAQASNLTNFPVMVGLTSSTVDYAQTQDSGQDIRFLDQDNSTLLPYEIETWDETGTSTIWVKVSQIDASSAADNIWMYYGNTSAADAQSATSVWDSNYKGVWHLGETVTDEGTTATHTDSTNTNNGTQKGNDDVAGKIGTAQDFDGTNDYITIANESNFDFERTQATTYEAWIYRDTSTTHENILGKVVSGLTVQGWRPFFIGANGTTFQYGLFNNWGGGGGNFLNVTSPTNTITTATWIYIAATYTGSSAASGVTLYKDGSALSSTINRDTLTATILNNISPEIGANNDGTAHPFDGKIDEVRISNTNRSADWIAANYKTMYGSFNTYASEETQVQGGGADTGGGY